MRNLFWDSARTPFTITWLDDLRVQIHPRTGIGRSLFVTGRYEPSEFWALGRILKPGMVILDVGANIGLYTLFAARRVGDSGTVVAIEPSRREFERLDANVQTNRLRNVRTRRAAVAGRSAVGELLISSESNSGHNTLGSLSHPGDTVERTEEVRVTSLDDLVEEEGLKRVDVIKMDIEGAEADALEGATRTLDAFHPALLLELSDRTLQTQGRSSGEIWRLLVERGYQIYSFDRAHGLPARAEQKAFFDAEDIIALHGESLCARLAVDTEPDQLVVGAGGQS